MAKVVKKTSKVKEKLAKSGDTLDMAPAVAQFKASEALSVEDMKKSMAEITEIQGTTDHPMPKRWGDRGPLTVATPGNIIDDPTYIPEYVTLYDGDKRHISNHRIIDGQITILTANSRGRFRWCRDDGRKIALHQQRGYSFCSYDEMFAGTGLFEKGTGDRIKNGDLYLMTINLDAWQNMKDEKLRIQAGLEGSEGNELFAAGAQMGVPTFQDNIKLGTREYKT